MTEQLKCRIYKIINDIDDWFYIGSTRLRLSDRMSVHRDCARKGSNKLLSIHMRGIGIEHFKIVLIRELMVNSRKEMRIEEQKEINNCGSDPLLLNTVRAYSHNHDKTRDPIKKRANRKAYYHRKKLDPEWMENERIRNRERMRIKRALLRNSDRD